VGGGLRSGDLMGAGRRAELPPTFCITLFTSSYPFSFSCCASTLAWAAPQKIPRFGIGIGIGIDEAAVALVEQ